MPYFSRLLLITFSSLITISTLADTFAPIVEIRIGANKRELSPSDMDPILLTTAAEKETLMANYYREFEFIKIKSNDLLSISKGPNVKSATLSLLSEIAKTDKTVVNVSLQITFEKDQYTHCYINIVKVGIDGRRKEIRSFNIDDYQFGRIQPTCELSEQLVLNLVEEAIELTATKGAVILSPMSNEHGGQVSKEDEFQ